MTGNQSGDPQDQALLDFLAARAPGHGQGTAGRPDRARTALTGPGHMT